MPRYPLPLVSADRWLNFQLHPLIVQGTDDGDRAGAVAESLQFTDYDAAVVGGGAVIRRTAGALA